MRTFKILFFAILASFGLNAQDMSLDQLKAAQAEKADAAAALQGEADALQAKIDKFPGWKTGGVGVIGLNGLANNNWFALGTPNSSNSGINIGASAFANLDQEGYFWNNLLNVNLARSAAFQDKDDDATKTVALTNGLDLSSLFGKKLNEKWALSAELKWISSLVEFEPGATVIEDSYKFALNSPGQATISAGLTWLPIDNLVVIFHPLGYQKNWPGEFASNAGMKIGATYSANILPNVAWTSNLSAFVPYGGAGDVIHAYGADDSLMRTVNYGTGDLMNWQWINGFSTKIWKGIGVSFNLGLASNRQIANKGRIVSAGADGQDALSLDDNPLQSYYTWGLGYTF